MLVGYHQLQLLHHQLLFLLASSSNLLVLSKLLVIDDLNQNTKSKTSCYPKHKITSQILMKTYTNQKLQITNIQTSNPPSFFMPSSCILPHKPPPPPPTPKKKTIQGQINPDNNNTKIFSTPNNNNKNTNDFCNSCQTLMLTADLIIIKLLSPFVIIKLSRFFFLIIKLLGFFFLKHRF